jgi:hypothetical protein
MSPVNARLTALLAMGAALAAAAGASCLRRGYPLGRAGNVDIRLDVAGALFATDTLDAKGRPSGPRQEPHRTGVTLSMTETSQAAFGAFVDVRVEPSEALALASDPDERGGEPTCTFTSGTFRCLATTEGLARFVVSSEGDWAGRAKLVVSWADQQKSQDIDVLPAGLPESATNLSLVIGGDAAPHVLATYVALQCSLGPVPDASGATWRPGQIRVREALVRATPPSGAKGVIANAPVVIESTSSEAALSLEKACASRASRMRVTLDATGQSPPFYLCFSDVGGDIALLVSSGQKVLDPNRHIIVDPEPRLLRVRALTSKVITSAAVDLFEVSAYDANRVRIPLPVDLRVGDDQVLGIGEASATLAGEESPATILQATPIAKGQTSLHVTPRLLSQPDCASELVTVATP